MPIAAFHQKRLFEILTWQYAGVAAEDAQKPLFDMLKLWGEYSLPGDPLTDSDYAAKTDALIHAWAKNKGLPLSLFMPGKSPVTPAGAPKEASSIIDRGLSLISVLNTIGVAAEVASAGQVESVIWSMMNIVNASGLPGVIGDLYRTPVDIGVKIPLERKMYSVYQPNIPDVATLTRLNARGIINDWAFHFFMEEHGYPDSFSDIMAMAEVKMPDFQTLLSLVRRTFISPKAAGVWLRRTGMHQDAVDPLLKLRWQLPGYADIISVYMREGYLPEKWVEIPTEFIDFMSQQGYSRDWALKLWGKHWVLPSVGLLYDMYHKHIIEYPDMVKMLKYHDFEPVWRDRLIENAYRMIPRVDLRRAYRYRMLEAAGLKERYEWLGYNPRDAGIMSGIATRWSLDRYYTRLETVARSAFRKRRISETSLISILKQVNTPDAAIPLIVQSETLAREAMVLEPAEEPPTLTLTAIRRQQISAASMLYREGLMDLTEYKGRLRKAKLSEEEIQAKIEVEDMRYRLDYARDLIALAKEAYRKDVYTASEFDSYLRGYGMLPERAAALVALETLRKLPKPRSPS